MARNETKVTVYDLDNKPHLMTHLNARDMLNHNGWSLRPVDRAAVAAGEALLAQELGESASPKVDHSALIKELDGKSKAQMIAFAKETFDVKIDGRKSEAEVIELILEAAEKGVPAPEAPIEAGAENDGAEGEGEGE